MSEVLDPQTRELLRSLEIGSREVLQGLRYGLHRSKRRGVSTDFTHHRGYQPGDPLKSLDWKVYARTGRHYVKQFLETSSLTVWVVLDTSTSMMDHPEAYTLSGQREKMTPKSDLSTLLAAALCNLVIRQQDSVGLVFTGDPPVLFPAKSSNRHLAVLFHELAVRRGSGGSQDPSSALRRLAETVSAGHLVVLISDLFFPPDATRGLLKELRGRGADVMLYHLENPYEQEFYFSHWVDFRCLESKGVHHRIDANLVREAYRKEHEEFLGEWKHFCKRQGVDLHRFDTTVSLPDILNTSLRERIASA